MINDYKYLGSIHDYDDKHFGYVVVDPDQDDPYTKDDIKVMINDLSSDLDGGLFYDEFPLQKMINVVLSLGGDCFWHETTDIEDMNVFFSKEMLEEMKEIGFKFVARIRTSGEEESRYTNQLIEFIQDKAKYYKRDVDYIEHQFFDFVQYESSELPRINSSILFSTIPIISPEHEQLLKPIGGEIIKFSLMEQSRLVAVEKEKEMAFKEEQEKQLENQRQIGMIEGYLKTQGLTDIQINEILENRNIPNQVCRR